MSDSHDVHERIPETLLRRLERLEQEYRRLRGTNRLLVVGLAVLLGTAAATVVTLALRLPRLSGDVVQARSFALRDANGRLRGVFGMATDGSSQLVLQDERGHARDRKSTRLNSSHLVISYAVFCLKKKKDDECRLHLLNDSAPVAADSE